MRGLYSSARESGCHDLSEHSEPPLTSARIHVGNSRFSSSFYVHPVVLNGEHSDWLNFDCKDLQ